MIKYAKVFPQLPGNYAIIQADANFTMVDATNSHLRTIGLAREQFIGNGIFDLFPDDPGGAGGGNLKIVKEALEKVVREKISVKPAILRYDIPKFGSKGFEIRYWQLEYSPVLGDDGNVEFIIQSSLDITSLVKMGLTVEKPI